MNLVDIWDAIQSERAHAIAKHTFKKTPANPEMSNERRLVIIAEEFGEVANAMTYDEGSWRKLREELIDLATMAVMALEGLNRSQVVTPDEVDAMLAQAEEAVAQPIREAAPLKTSSYSWRTTCPTTGQPISLDSLNGIARTWGCCNAPYGPGLAIHDARPMSGHPGIGHRCPSTGRDVSVKRSSRDRLARWGCCDTTVVS